MEPTIQKELQDQRLMIEKIYISVEKTRKYFLWTMIVTLITFILPLIILGFALPSFLSVYTSQLQGLGI